MNDTTTGGLIRIGDHAKCPKCSRTGRVIWISQDGKRAGIQCPMSCSQMSRGDSKFGSPARPQKRREKTLFFL